MKPRRLAEAGLKEIEAAAEQRDLIPTDKQLAEKWHVSVNWVKCLMRDARKRLTHQSVVSRETFPVHNRD